MEVIPPSISENVDTFIEPESNKISGVETNNVVTINTAEFQDPLELSLEIEATYGLKPCFVELERCDKIWETIQLIRDLQEDPNPETSDDETGSEMTDDYYNYDNDTVNNDDAETINGDVENSNLTPINYDVPSSSHHDTESCSSTQNNPTAPYIKYQPVLGNGNTALPNFQFSVQRTRVLYPCVTCGKQYNHIRSLKEHEERIHNIIQPPVRKKSDHGIKNETNSSNNQENEVSNNNKSVESAPVKNIRSDDTTIVDTTEFIKSVMACEPGTRITCCFCDRIYSDKYNLKKHVVAIHGGAPELIRSYKRKQPSQSIPEPEPAVEEAIHQEPPQKKRRVERSRNLNVYRCETCGKHFYSLKNKRVHNRKVHGIYIRSPAGKNVNKQVGNNHNNNSKKSNEGSKVQTKLSLSSSSLTYESPTKNSIPENQNSENSILRTCPICNLKTTKLNVFKTHCKSHGITIKFDNIYPREQDKTELDCKVCGETFMTSNHVVEHYWNIHRRCLRYKCYICGALSHESENLVKHLLKVHKVYFLLRKPIYNFQCHVCMRNFSSKSVYRMHVTQGHGLDLKTKQVEEVLKSTGRIDYDASPLLPPPPPPPPLLSPRSASAKKRAIKRGLKRPAQIKRQVKVEKPRLPSTRNGLREKSKFNYNENISLLDTAVNFSNSSLDEIPIAQKRTRRSSALSNDKSNHSISDDVPMESKPKEPTYCILCSKNGFKNLRKHFLEYHKVRDPDPLIEQSLKMMPATSEPVIKAEKTVKKEVKIEKKKVASPVKKAVIRRRSNPEARKINARVKQQVSPIKEPCIPGPLRTFAAVRDEDGSLRFICKYCPLELKSYEKMRRDEYSHRREFSKLRGVEMKPSNPKYLNMDPDLILKQKIRKANSSLSKSNLLMDDPESLLRRSSFPLETFKESNNYLTQESIKQYQEPIEHRCSNCSRLFRNGDILASHKISCKVRVDHQQITNDTSDTRESSDRDSGIGISITIKKKNDSYEIVSRDNSDDSKSQDSESRPNELLLTDTPSDILLNGIIPNQKNSEEVSTTISNNNVLELNETREEIKIQKIDNDENMDVDADDQNTIPVPSPVIVKPQVTKRKISAGCRVRQIPSLVLLCTHALDRIHANESCTRKCYICNTDWPSAISRASHMTGIHKSGRR
ncbi:uncharacterized protein LOC123263964 [Cotesia glomerata]|uniref:C2H2-type domain-containing protein n=1 Tax=Cotesia glomerata TaxID=32391 RepID=A0AAV7IUU5_COTGL|nr:uncharacterized protein LOC123263964 [Cotesia glomerata]KAH0568624.1 hypothetical protein KQX54_021310 [Cotesia glomerata]